MEVELLPMLSSSRKPHWKQRPSLERGTLPVLVRGLAKSLPYTRVRSQFEGGVHVARAALPPFEAGPLGLTSAGLERAALAGVGANLAAFNGGGYKLSMARADSYASYAARPVRRRDRSVRSPSPARLNKAAMTQLSRGVPGLRLPLSPWPGEFDMCDTTELVLRLFFNGSHRGSYEVPIV